ncbi:MAG TPA: hypothetical protein VG755_08230 [Nannocystaceae bacterium]|nr:hypothetical protein [Nannocystaceae bacterium]
MEQPPVDPPRARDDSTMARHFTADPFHVLQTAPGANRRELDGAAAELLDALARGVPGAERYETPLGERARDPEVVNAAAHELHDRENRIVHEVWAKLPTRARAVVPPPAPAPWAGGERAFGWRSR